MLTLELKTAKDFFFDRQAVIQRIGRDRARFLRNAGGFARKTARNSMKRRGSARKPPKNMNGRAYAKWQEEVRLKQASTAGSPPNVHTSDAVRSLRNILFASSSNDVSVIVGPVGLRHKRLRAGGGIIPPELHEYGGTTPIHEKLQDVSPAIPRKTGRRRLLTPSQKAAMIRRLQAKGLYAPGTKWVPLGRGAKKGQPTRVRSATYPARPFMGPAVAKTRDKFKDLWFTNAAALRSVG